MKQSGKTHSQGKHKKQNKNQSGSNAIEIRFRESDILQRWLITSQGCPSCAAIKKDMKKEFASGVIKSTDVGDLKGFEILTTLGITEAPMFVIELKPGHPSGIRYVIDE